jgi:hypothetical protein
LPMRGPTDTESGQDPQQCVQCDQEHQHGTAPFCRPSNPSAKLLSLSQPVSHRSVKSALAPTTRGAAPRPQARTGRRRRAE